MLGNKNEIRFGANYFNLTFTKHYYDDLLKKSESGNIVNKETQDEELYGTVITNIILYR